MRTILNPPLQIKPFDLETSPFPAPIRFPQLTAGLIKGGNRL